MEGEKGGLHGGEGIKRYGMRGGTKGLSSHRR